MHIEKEENFSQKIVALFITAIVGIQHILNDQNSYALHLIKYSLIHFDSAYWEISSVHEALRLFYSTFQTKTLALPVVKNILNISH